MTEQKRQGGISDGFIVGLFALILGLAVLVWTATGLAGLLAHGAWPAGVTFARTPMALRALATAPTDLPAAWPTTPPGALSGYGLFWGLLIGEAMILMVLAVFVLGTTARWRAVRANRKAGAYAPTPARKNTEVREDPEARKDAGVRKEPTAPPPPRRPTEEHASAPTPAPAPLPTPTPPAEAPPATPITTPRTVYGPPETRRPAAVQAILDAEGPVLVVTSDPAVWSSTKDARGKLGPVLVHDPGHLCDTPARLHWSPSEHCEDPAVAQERAVALLAPVRPHSRLDAATADTAETLLRCWLHAAAVDGRPFRQVHRWAQGAGAHEPVRILRSHPKAASGLAGLLESALTAHPESRRQAQELTARALSSLSSIHIREACVPNRTDSLTLASFLAEGGTLYVVGEAIEDPRTHPGAMPLLTALAASVVEHGRRMAARSSDGRLDPPLTLVLDDVAAVAPLPQLPDLLATGHTQGLPTLALMRSEEQAKARWPNAVWAIVPQGGTGGHTGRRPLPGLGSRA
ncbi:type IV secretory system conjugative DNA transfer family protein [Streptomyces vietnamensis]|uniref:type IV secretory system conjugative DNA transfer family protein n=1 Tax=Streptomyces vietnamensis TaxID=362257 RepID=UPI000AD5A545|nr:type IV secretory system conjugative DNA transfer family protein [Streptomyces vietnamensis]